MVKKPLKKHSEFQSILNREATATHKPHLMRWQFSGMGNPGCMMP